MCDEEEFVPLHIFLDEGQGNYKRGDPTRRYLFSTKNDDKRLFGYLTSPSQIGTGIHP